MKRHINLSESLKRAAEIGHYQAQKEHEKRLLLAKQGEAASARPKIRTMNTEPTTEELKAQIEDIKRQLALALDAAVGRSSRASDTGGCSAFAAIRRTKYPHEYAGWNVEHDSPKWTSDRLFAAPVPLETLVSELNKVAARETNIWAVVYPQDTPSRP